MFEQASEYVAEYGDTTPKDLALFLNITKEKAKNLIEMMLNDNYPSGATKQ